MTQQKNINISITYFLFRKVWIQKLAILKVKSKQGESKEDERTMSQFMAKVVFMTY